jgi:hypothetical protein
VVKLASGSGRTYLAIIAAFISEIEWVSKLLKPTHSIAIKQPWIDSRLATKGHSAVVPIDGSGGSDLREMGGDRDRSSVPGRGL